MYEGNVSSTMISQEDQAVKGDDSVRNPHDLVPPATRKRTKKPPSRREMTTRERIILLESSKLNGNIYPPWIAPNASDFDTTEFIDVVELSFSDLQLDVFDSWKRPAELSITVQSSLDTNPHMMAERSIDLVQDVTTDCSVVASLCAASARVGRGKADVMFYHPQIAIQNG